MDGLLWILFLRGSAPEAEMEANVEHQGKQNANHAQHDQQGGEPVGHLRENQQGQTGCVEHRGTDLAIPLRAENAVRALHRDQAKDQHHGLADDAKSEQIPHQRVRKGQTEDQRDLRQLVGHGIEGFTEVGDHIEFPRDRTVQHVGQGRHRQQNDGQRQIVQADVGPDDKGQKHDPKHGQKIRNRQNLPLAKKLPNLHENLRKAGMNRI